MKISGWGRYPLIDAKVKSPTSIDQIIETILNEDSIPRGNGRSYGDSAISKNNTICMKNFNRMLKFDNKKGLIVVESGILLSEIIKTFLPRGWFPKVTPGSKFVTIGGMVACDVHGKNHHKDGSFGKYVEWIDIITTDGEIKRCSRKINDELFNWTIGGMGLTGVILNVAFYLHPVNTSWIKQKTIPAKNIDHAIKIFEENIETTYSVAWLDCLSKGDKLGRSLVMLGEHAEISDLNFSMKKDPLIIKNKKKIRIIFNFPSFFLNTLIIKLLSNIYYFFSKKKKGYKLVDYDSYFYPLDYVLDWNKIYGRSGFVQFQCVLPLKTASAGIRELLDAVSNSKSSSFLTVLKRFGRQESYFSFPMEGYTLTFDFPVTKKNMKLMELLDAITLKYKGRFYLAKDSRMTSHTLEQSDNRFEKYKKFRSLKMKKSFSSVQSERLGL